MKTVLENRFQKNRFLFENSFIKTVYFSENSLIKHLWITVSEIRFLFEKQFYENSLYF